MGDLYNYGKNILVTMRTYFAVDINSECEKLKEENTTIFIGSQSDPVFLTDIIK